MGRNFTNVFIYFSSHNLVGSIANVLVSIISAQKKQERKIFNGYFVWLSESLSLLILRRRFHLTSGMKWKMDRPRVHNNTINPYLLKYITILGFMCVVGKRKLKLSYQHGLETENFLSLMVSGSCPLCLNSISLDGRTHI